MSSIAVFLVLGSATALAAGQLGKNSVGSKQLKKNAVTAAKIKKNAITMAKIKNGAVSGAKIDLATLGTVPSATKATSATTAGSANTAGSATKATSATTAANLTGYKPFGVFVGAGLHDVATFAPFTIKAQCTLNNGGSDEGEFLLFTSVDGAAMDDNNGDEFVPFNISDNPAALYEESNTAGTEDIEVAEAPGLTAVAPNGVTVILQNETIGFNIAGHPGQCYFGGVALQAG
jgi:hypothetical protein